MPKINIYITIFSFGVTMKKILPLFLLLSCCFLLCSCGKTSDYSEYVSQIRENCFTGESDSLAVTAYAEMREYPLKSDGFVGEMSNYLILKIRFKSDQNMLKTDLSAHFYIDKEYSADLSFRAETDSYVANVRVDKLPEEGFTVTLVGGEKPENVTLMKAPVSITADKALKAATAYKKDLLTKLVADKSDFEIMIRLILQGGDAYYYVGITETEFTTALLISSEGKVIAEKRLKNQ